MHAPPEVASDLTGRFFLPGPTEVLPDVLQAQVAPLFGHRDPEIHALLGDVQTGLKEVFGTERPVYVVASSGTGLMEGAIRNAAGRRTLCLVNGAFSARFAEIARACAKDCDVLEVPWGEVHDPDDVGRELARHDYDTVTVVHSETSTGALQPLEALAAVVRGKDDCLLLVDSVSGVGGAPLLTDEWGLDFVLTGSQKALAVPPGLALGVASSRLLERARGMAGRGLYFDLVRFEENIAALQTPNTPALTLLFALRAQLERMRAEGAERRLRRHAEMARRCWEWVEEQRRAGHAGLGVVAVEGHRSPTVTCIRLPRGLHGPDIVAGVKERGFVIGDGYGKLKGTTIRIGHMGNQSLVELESVLAVVGEVLATP